MEIENIFQERGGKHEAIATVKKGVSKGRQIRTK